MTPKDLKKLSDQDIKKLKNLLDIDKPLLAVPDLEESDPLSAVIYEILFLLLKAIRDKITNLLDKNKVDEKNDSGAPVTTYSLPHGSLVKLSDHLDFFDLKHIPILLDEIEELPEYKRAILGPTILKDINIKIDKTLADLADYQSLAYTCNPDFVKFKRSLSNIDFDIFLCVVLFSDLITDYIKTFFPKRGPAERISKDEIFSLIGAFYKRNQIKDRLSPTSPLIENWILDASNSDFSIFELSPMIVQSLFKQKGRVSGRPLYEVIDTLPIKLEDMVLLETYKDHIQHLCNHQKSLHSRNIKDRLTFLFRGEPGTGKTSLAHAISNELGMKVININVGEHTSAPNNTQIPDVILSVMRRAESKNMVLLFDECESVINANQFRGKSDAWIKKLFDTYKGVAIFTTNYSIPYGFDRRINYIIDLKRPDSEARLLILQKEIKSMIKAGVIQKGPPEEKLKEIIKNYDVAGGYFSQTLKLAASLSNPSDTIEPEKLEQAFNHISSTIIRKDHNANQDNDAVRPAKIKLEDVHVDAELQEETELFIKQARGVIDNNQPTNPFLPKGATGFFYGLPGTGKTILAEAIAQKLNIPFRRVSPSSFLSKWVGETEQNIKTIFKDAEKNKYLLFIDEAEGLFLDRKDAKVSWEKNQVDELLQQLEDFKGVLIVATNFKEMIDEAFGRRFLFKFGFKIPNRETREKLWNSWKADLKLADEEVQNLARHELSGGEIRNTAVLYCIKGKDKGLLYLESLCENAIKSRTGYASKKIGL